MDFQKEICSICSGSMKAGEGKSLFTAECSHVFHFDCISSRVFHGVGTCPVCGHVWKNLPFRAPLPHDPSPPPFYPFQAPPQQFVNSPFAFGHREPALPSSNDYADVEALPSATPTSSSPQSGGMTVKALPEYPALSRSHGSASFSVLVGIKAPALPPEASDRPGGRAPIDLVAVLDVSGSMEGNKMRLVKQALGFVIDSLGPTDRLSVVTFSSYALRVTPFRRMTDAGRADTSAAVSSLRADGSTDIIAGLRVAVQVLEQRRQRNPVASIVLLSDGQDNMNGYAPYNSGPSRGFSNALRLLPLCVRTRDVVDISELSLYDSHQNEARVEPVPVHTFGFGSDHDPIALHAVADQSGGTFSYIESIEVIQDAFAQCIGGLLSVVAQEVEIHVNTLAPGVRILKISSGRYRSRIDANGQNGVVYVEEAYAEEEKQFLVHLTVPQENQSLTTTQLLEAKCSYKDPMSNETLLSETKRVEIRRPPADAMSEADRLVSLEVDREKNRVLVAEGIARAQEMAERGELDEASSLLGERRQLVLQSRSALAGDAFSRELGCEMAQAQQCLSSRDAYEDCGKGYVLSMGSSHMNQRANTQAARGFGASFGFGGAAQSSPFGAAAPTCPTGGGFYRTSQMEQMVDKSRRQRRSDGQKQ